MAVPPPLEEVEESIKKKNNKAAGPDGIPAEVFKAGGPKSAGQVHELIEKIWLQEAIPSDPRDALIVTIFTKGDKSDCGKYRGISLLSIARKIIAGILATRRHCLKNSYQSLNVDSDHLEDYRCHLCSAPVTGEMSRATHAFVHGLH